MIIIGQLVYLPWPETNKRLRDGLLETGLGKKRHGEVPQRDEKQGGENDDDTTGGSKQVLQKENPYWEFCKKPGKRKQVAEKGEHSSV